MKEVKETATMCFFSSSVFFFFLVSPSPLFFTPPYVFVSGESQVENRVNDRFAPFVGFAQT
jgi:hypothetical protein